MSKDNKTMFKLEDKNLTLDLNLAEYNDTMALFICKNSEDYYLCYCTDIKNLTYIISLITKEKLIEFLKGKITIEKAFQSGSEYWQTKATEGDDLINCKLKEITKKNIKVDNYLFLDGYYTLSKNLLKQYLAQK